MTILKQDFFIGVDGGGSKSIIRLEDATGRLLGETTRGPASIRLSVTKAWAAIQEGIAALCDAAGLSLQTQRFHVGMGLAGCEVKAAYADFCAYPHAFQTLAVTSDAYTACLGAHGGADGAIIIAGTGVVGVQVQAGQFARVSGWGFPHDDIGGGAWLGLEAVKQTLQWLDGRAPASRLTHAIHAHFQGDTADLVVWANEANSTAFATLAPIVIAESQAGDAAAQQLLAQAGAAISQVAMALPAFTQLPCALMGGIATFIESYLQPSLRERIRPCLATPAAGAIYFVKAKEKYD